jgi:hypothetical protein
MEKRVFTYIALFMSVWAIFGTVMAGYYFTQYNTYHNEYGNLATEYNALSDAIKNMTSEMKTSVGNVSEVLESQVGNLSKVLESTSLRAGILVSYGNGTKVWHNNTALPVGSTAFTAILAVADIRYTDYGGDLGILVTSIDGLANNSTHGWFYWYRDTEKSEWVLPEYSCTDYILHRGDMIAFTYASYMAWPPPSPS